MSRCQALDLDGRQCPQEGVDEHAYHGDPEIVGTSSGDRPLWVLVSFCRRHGFNAPFERPADSQRQVGDGQ